MVSKISFQKMVSEMVQYDMRSIKIMSKDYSFNLKEKNLGGWPQWYGRKSNLKKAIR